MEIVNIKHFSEKYKVIAIILLGFCVYIPSFFSPFIWDDIGLIINNPLIKELKFLPKIFTVGISPGDLPSRNFYRPVQSMINMFDFQVWRNNPFGYHLTNVCLHIICAILLYYFFSRLFKKELAAFLSACLFVVHPVNVEAVSYISGRADPLVLLFLLLSFINYLNFQLKGKAWSLLLSGLFFTFGIFSKELAISAILIYVLIDYVLDRKFHYKLYSLFALIGTIFFFLRFIILGMNLPHNSLTISSRVLTFIVSIFDYLKILILPAKLHMSYTTRVFSYISVLFLIKLFCVCMFFILFLYFLRQQKKIFLFCSAWFFIFLIPQSGVFPINAYFAEHFIYLSEYAIFFVVVTAILQILNKKNLVFFYLTFIFFIFALSSVTVAYAKAWIEPVKFFQRIILYSPNSFAAYNNLGVELEKHGLHEEARRQFLIGLSINPGDMLALNNLGRSFMDEGQINKAIVIFKRAIEKEPEKPVLHYNLATAYDLSGDEPAALAEYEKAFRLAQKIAPWDFSTHFELGLVLYGAGKNSEAAEEFKKAISLKPEDPAAHVSLGVVFKAMGKFQDAVDEYRKALELDPNFAQAYNNLGVIYALVQDRDSALDYFSRALRIDAKFDEARFNLGLLYLEKRDFERGRRELNLISENSKLYSLAQEELKSYKLKDKNKKH